MFKEKKKHEIKNWFDNFIDAYTHPKKKKNSKTKTNSIANESIEFN